MGQLDAQALTTMLVVRDTAVSRRWYVDVLEAEVAGEYGTSVVLRLLGAWLLLVEGGGPDEGKPTVQLAPPSDLDRVGQQLILRVADCEAAYDLLSGRGASFLAPPHVRPGETRAFLRDPDGHLIEISALT